MVDELVRFAIASAVVGAAGWPWLHGFPRLERILVAPVAGLLWLVPLLLGLGTLQAPLSWPLAAACAAAVHGMGRRLAQNDRWPEPPPSSPRRTDWTWVLALGAVLLFAAKVALVRLWSWDHFAIWGVKARWMVTASHLDLGFLRDPAFHSARPDHPLALPATWRLLALGQPPGAILVKLCHVLLGLALLAAFHVAARRLGRRRAVLPLAVAVVASTPLYWDTESLGLAEMLLGATALVAAASWLGTVAGPRRAVLAGAALAFLPWTKTEGLPLAALLLAALWIARPPVSRREALELFAPFVLLTAAAIAFQRLALPAGVGFFAGDFQARLLARLPESGTILRRCASDLLERDWWGLWPLSLLGLILAARRRRWPAVALGAAVWTQIALYALTAYGTYLNPLNHLEAAFFRIAAPLAPLALLALLAALSPRAAAAAEVDGAEC